MKIIYLKNNGGVKKGEIREVSEGFARNFLLPQGIAASAEVNVVTKIKSEVIKVEKTKVSAVDTAKKLAEKIRGRKIEIKTKANEAGKLYASVSEAEIKSALEKLVGGLGEGKIFIGKHIKEPGDHRATVDFGHGIKSEINVNVKI